MGALTRVTTALRAAESRAYSALIGNPQDPAYWVLKLFGGANPVVSGMDVNPKSALSWTAASAAVRISAETIGSLPWNVFEQQPTRTGPNGERLPGGALERPDHPLHFLLHSEPNEEMTSMEFFETAQSHALWWGGSPSQIVRNGKGVIEEIWPLNPDRCRWVRRDGELWLRVTLPRDGPGSDPGGAAWLPYKDVLWVRGFSIDGLYGLCLPDLHKEAVGLGLVTEQFVGAFFGRGANAGGVITHPKSLSEKARAFLRQSLDQQVGGIDRAHRLMLLEEGMQWQQTTIDPEKSQLLGLRTFQIGEVARMTRIPLHMLAELSHATFSNIEEQSLEFVRDHVRPWVVRWQQRLNKDLLGIKDKSNVFIKADMEELTVGRLIERVQAYQVMINSRIATPNQIRDKFGWMPGPADLDQYQVTPNLNPPKPAVAEGA